MNPLNLLINMKRQKVSQHQAVVLFALNGEGQYLNDLTRKSDIKQHLIRSPINALLQRGLIRKDKTAPYRPTNGPGAPATAYYSLTRSGKEMVRVLGEPTTTTTTDEESK